MCDWFGCGASWKEDLLQWCVACVCRKCYRYYRRFCFSFFQISLGGSLHERRSVEIIAEPSGLVCFFFRFPKSVSISFKSWKCECFSCENYATRFHGTQVPDARIKSWQLLVLVFRSRKARRWITAVNTDGPPTDTNQLRQRKVTIWELEELPEEFFLYRITAYMR